MSLRDALLAKGLVSKKDAKRVERELAEQRRAEQGQQRRKHELQAEEEARRQAEEQARQQALVERRRLAEAQRVDAERRLQVLQLLTGNRQRPGTGQAFWHRSADGRRLVRTTVSSGTAFQLRCGELAIAALDRGLGPEYVVIPKRTALRLEGLAPEVLVFFVSDPSGLSDPALRFAEPLGEPSLRPHRATEADLRRLRGAPPAG